MRIGVDLDNTIICYDRVFETVAREKGLVPDDFIGAKREVKTEILRRYDHDVWTSLQCEVYGPRSGEAEPYPGVIDFFRRCYRDGIPTHIISHKTQFAAAGPKFNLHQAARLWLARKRWFEPDGLSMREADFEFHATRAEKVSAISRHRCDIFIDDLPEVFAEPDFPKETVRILFDPNFSHTPALGTQRATSWFEISAIVFRETENLQT